MIPHDFIVEPLWCAGYMEILCFMVNRLNKAFAWARRQAGPFSLPGLAARLLTRKDGAAWDVEIVDYH